MLAIDDITIDPEFEACCPAISEKERTQLTANIIRDRQIRDPLVVWLGHGILVDGHNRLDIWRNACDAAPDMAPEIIEKPFKDREDALGWIVRNQLGRRNLTDAQRVVLALKLKPALAAKARENQSAAGGDKALSTNSSKAPEPVNVRAEVAKAAGVSEDTVAKVSTVIESGYAETAQDMLAGKVSVNAAAKRVKTAGDQQAPRPQGEVQGKAVRYGNEAINALKKIRNNDALRTRGFQVAGEYIAKHCPEALDRSTTEAPPVATLESLQAAFLKLPAKARKEFFGFAIQHTVPPRRLRAREAETLELRFNQFEQEVVDNGEVATLAMVKSHTRGLRAACRGFITKDADIPPSWKAVSE